MQDLLIFDDLLSCLAVLDNFCEMLYVRFSFRPTFWSIFSFSKALAQVILDGPPIRSTVV